MGEVFAAIYGCHVSEVGPLIKLTRIAGLKWKPQFTYGGKDYCVLVGPDRQKLVDFLVEQLKFTREDAEKEVR